jgi:2-oxo-4-hydroxy-4-carboxy--5-ureidoimidazoline (OHCU) decarboxylase
MYIVRINFPYMGYLKNCEKNSVSRLGSDRIEQTHEFIVKSNVQLHQ